MEYLTATEMLALNDYVDNWTCVTDDGIVLELQEVGASDFFHFVEELFGTERKQQLCLNAYEAYCAFDQ